MTSLALDLEQRDATAPARSASTGLVARLHASAAEIDTLRPRWRALEAIATGATVFQSDAWTASIAAARGLEGAAILTVAEGDTLVALLPLRILNRAGGRIATGFGEPFQQYTEILLAPGTDGAAALRLMLATLRAEARPDAITLHKVRADSALAGAIAGLGPASPFVPSAEAG